MGKNIQRILNINKKHSSFLWGARKTGKSHWIKNNFNPDEIVLIDLLKTDTFAEYASRPALLRERFQDTKKLIVLDEIQKVPLLLDEVHWMIENKQAKFLLTGSSARKLRRNHANLLAGRAIRYEMLPFSYQEVKEKSLDKILISGMLPPHYLSSEPLDLIRSYVADYLKEEIANEAKIQQIPQFSQFLKIAGITSGEMLNYDNVARESGVSSKVVRNYFDILETTMLGFRVSPWKSSKNRRLISAEKFYLFDTGIANYLARRRPAEGTPEYGKSFEHFILMELRAYRAYRNPELEITYWRTSTGYEVDFILNDKQVALEIKSGRMVHDIDLKSLKALREDGPIKHSAIVCQESYPRELDGVKILPWQIFLEMLWNKEFGI